VRSELSVTVVMISAHGGLFDGAVYALDLAVGLGMVGFGGAVIDAMAPAGPAKGMAAQQGGRGLVGS